jgi:hypothetical protein
MAAENNALVTSIQRTGFGASLFAAHTIRSACRFRTYLTP